MKAPTNQAEAATLEIRVRVGNEEFALNDLKYVERYENLYVLEKDSGRLLYMHLSWGTSKQTFLENVEMIGHDDVEVCEVCNKIFLFEKNDYPINACPACRS